jgi:hypothetical protein
LLSSAIIWHRTHRVPHHHKRCRSLAASWQGSRDSCGGHAEPHRDSRLNLAYLSSRNIYSCKSPERGERQQTHLSVAPRLELLPTGAKRRRRDGPVPHSVCSIQNRSSNRKTVEQLDGSRKESICLRTYDQRRVERWR